MEDGRLAFYIFVTPPRLLRSLESVERQREEPAGGIDNSSSLIDPELYARYFLNTPDRDTASLSFEIDAEFQRMSQTH